jgi:HlyD family secretion protein
VKPRARFLALVLVLALVAGGIWYISLPGSGETESLTASGTVEATDADLGFQAPGRILQVFVGEGARVQPGQELARLDTGELEAALLAARAQVAASEARLSELVQGARPQEIMSAEASLRASEERAAEAQRELERTRVLFQGGAVSRQTLDLAETGVAVALAAREQAEQGLALVREGPRVEAIAMQRALVEQARANVARAEAALENAVILAPFPGVITIRHREPGEAVSAGAPVLTLLDPQDRWVRIYVREDQIGRVQLGTSAEITSDTYPDRIYGGEVVFLGNEAEFTPRNVQTSEERTRLVYPVKVRIVDDPEFVLKPGIPADVTLIESGS